MPGNVASTDRLDFKSELVNGWFAEFGGEPATVLDLGCGDCASVAGPLAEHPNITYVGVEQDASALAAAKRLLAGRAGVQLLESPGEAFAGAGHDLVISLSVLEHVKHLDAFLEASVSALAPGGRLLHRYDLGHALAPSTPGERLRVAVARRVPAVVRSQRFTTYPDLDAILATLRRLGIGELEVSQSQAPSLKQAVNHIDQSTDEGRALVASILDLDKRLWSAIGTDLPRAKRDRLFPSVLVSGRRAAA